MSSVGGSIRVQENFEDDIPLYEENIMPRGAQPWAMNPSFIPEESMYKPPPRIYAKCLNKNQNKPKRWLEKQETQKNDLDKLEEEEEKEEEEAVNEENVSPFAMDGDFAPV
jgi:hypothetical protein